MLIRYSTELLGLDPFSIRLVSLLSGISLLFIAPLITFVISRNKFAVLLTLLLSSLNPGMVYYSQTARGYMLQSLLLLSIILFLLLLQKNILNKYLCSALVMILSILSILTLPTSVMFLFPIFLSHLIYLICSNLKKGSFILHINNLIKENIQIIIAYALISLFSVFFYTLNYSQFKAGQSFGYRISSFQELYSFASSTLISLAILPIILFFFFSFIKKSIRLYSASCLFLILISLAFSLITKAGPVRVYLPLVAPIIIFASIGISSAAELIKFKGLRYLLQLILFAASGFFYCHTMENERFSWINPNWPSALRTAYSNMPANSYVTIPATSGYPVIFSFPEIFEIEKERTPRRKDAFLVNLREGKPTLDKTLSYKSIFNGINPINYQTETIELTFESKPKIIDMSSTYGCFGEIFKINRVSLSDDIPDYIFMSLVQNETTKSINIDLPENIIVMNFWFRILKLKAKELTFIIKNKVLSSEELIQLERESDGQIIFYTITPLTK